jgi:hypothetical protein
VLRQRIEAAAHTAPASPSHSFSEKTAIVGDQSIETRAFPFDRRLSFLPHFLQNPPWHIATPIGGCFHFSVYYTEMAA